MAFSLDTKDLNMRQLQLDIIWKETSSNTGSDLGTPCLLRLNIMSILFSGIKSTLSFGLQKELRDRNIERYMIRKNFTIKGNRIRGVVQNHCRSVHSTAKDLKFLHKQSYFQGL